MNEQRIALVTGANKGIGFEIARQLAQAGVMVVMGVRDNTRGSAAVEALRSQDLSVQYCELDITRHDSIAAAVSSIKAEFGRLDILVNNAGVFDHADGSPGKAAIEAVRQVMETNFIGTLAVTQAMLPLLRAAPAARIVNVSSSLGSLALNGDPTSTYYAAQFIGYNASKAALNMLTVQLNEELKGAGITINSISPGFVKTDLTGYGTMTPAEGAKLPVKYALAENESGEFMGPDGRTPW
ncbi:SDR family oxidoreductase [Klebsiella sp. WOUb02]|uniref:SDR family oxidoreductase n=1 Tax=Klebsiella sp. WOUb02 TaxID=3161071 RepID=UPI003CEF2448